LKTQFIQPQLSALKPLWPLAQQLATDIQNSKVTEASLKQIGLALWQVLNIQHYTAHHLIMSSDNPMVHQLPWECLYHPHYGFLGQHLEYGVSRYTHDAQFITPSTGPLKILLFTAQPRQAITLATDIEQHYLRAQLQPAIAQGHIQLLAPNDGRFSTLIQLLHQQHWDLVLLSGHGHPAEFIFEDEAGQAQAVAADTLAASVQQAHISCMVFTACYSSPGLVLSMHHAGIPHVIGMQAALIDKASQIFISHLCLALSQGICLATAVQQGRLALTQLLANNEVWRDNRLRPCADPSVGQWCLPVLFSCDPSQTLTHQRSQMLQSTRQMPEPVFIGRRQALRTLTEALQHGRYRHLVITGDAGIGKTALAHQLVLSLAEYGFKVLKYQHQKPFNQFLAQALLLPPATPLSQLIDELDKQGQWLLWVEGALAIELQAVTTSRHGRLLCTARRCEVKWLEEYRLAPADYADFLRYSQHLGLAYPTVYIQIMYRHLKGNFRGLQLFQSLPPCLEPKDFKKQLALVQRYLAAYRQ